MRARDAALVVLLLAVPRPARAETHRQGDVGILDVGVLSMRGGALPPLVLRGDDAPRRFVGIGRPAGEIPPTIGFSAGLVLRIDAFLFDLVDVRWSRTTSALGGSSAVANETAVSAQAGEAQIVELGFFGPGVQLVGATAKLRASLDWGLVHASAPASMQDAWGSESGGSFVATAFQMRLDGAACLRTADGGATPEGSTWICLNVSPTIYEGGFFRGVAVGLGIDL